MKPPAPRTHTVPPELAGERLDRALSALFALSRSRARELIEQGAVFVGRRRVLRLSHAVRAGDALRTDPQFTPPRVPDLRGRVLYADDALLVLDKPAGMPTGPTPVGAAGTLLFEAHRQRLAPFRPCEVHRLDAPTSGAVAFVREGRALRDLMEQFRSGAVRKRYLCRVHGAPAAEEFLLTAPLAPDPRRPHHFRAAAGEAPPPGARAAETRVRVLWRGPGYTDLEIEPRTGRTHQIRVHLSAAGLPLWGDHAYGDPEADRACAPGRLWLHAAGLSFRHPLRGGPVEVAAPLPADMAAFGGAAEQPGPTSH